jgi:hypothetical protein
MSHTRLVPLLLSAVVASSLALPVMAKEWIIPAASHAPGAANTNWRTDLRIVNPAGSAADVRIDLLPQGSDNTARSNHTTVHVAAQGQLSLGDVLASQFSFTGNAALLVGSSESSLIVTSRTYNEAPGGATYGQFIPGVPVADALANGAAGHLIYVTKSADYRTNVGFAGTTAASGQVTIKLFDASGQQLGSGTFDVLPYGQAQVNDIFAAANAPAAAVARAVVTSTVPVVAYASIIDNRTGDPIAMIAAKDSESSTLLAIPGIAHLAGAASSLWRSDVRIFHPDAGGDSATVVLTYYPGNVANPTPVTRTVSIGANRIVALDDILLATFGNDNGSGALKIQSDGKLLVTSRTFNQSTSGTFGQDIPAVAYDKALSASATSLFSGLSDSRYRTNVGFFNLSATPIDLTLSLKSPAGAVLASKPFHLDPNIMTQMNLFSFLGAAGTAAASLSVSGSGAGSYWAYASVIDSVSGDPVFVPAALSTASSGNPDPSAGCVTVPFVAAGKVLGYRTSDGSYSSEQTVVSDSATHTVLHDKVVAGGISEDIDTTYDYVVQGELRAATHLVSVAVVHSVINITVNTDITYAPAFVLSPVSSYCAGATFAIPATAQTVKVTGTVPGPTTTTNRAAATGEILAVHESLTVAAGTFDTVKFRSTQGGNGTDVAYSYAWVDIATGVLVRQQQFGSGGNTIQLLDLTSMH